MVIDNLYHTVSAL